MAQTTANFGFNIAEGTDVVNLLTQCYTNFTSLDSILKGIKDTGVTVATDTKVGTVHQLVRTDSDCNMFRFIATGNYASGDTFTVDGNAVTATAMDGTTLPAGAFVINQSVVGILNGLVLTIVGVVGASSVDADDVTYDNSISGLTATDVQDAIDELAAGAGTIAASSVTYDNTLSGLTAADVQAAIDELKALIPATPQYITTGLTGTRAIINDGGYYIDANNIVHVDITFTLTQNTGAYGLIIDGFPQASTYNGTIPYNVSAVFNNVAVGRDSAVATTYILNATGSTMTSGTTVHFIGSYTMA